jgi:hypothetical protein
MGYRPPTPSQAVACHFTRTLRGAGRQLYWYLELYQALRGAGQERSVPSAVVSPLSCAMCSSIWLSAAHRNYLASLARGTGCFCR